MCNSASQETGNSCPGSAARSEIKSSINCTPSSAAAVAPHHHHHEPSSPASLHDCESNSGKHQPEQQPLQQEEQTLHHKQGELIAAAATLPERQKSNSLEIPDSDLSAHRANSDPHHNHSCISHSPEVHSAADCDSNGIESEFSLSPVSLINNQMPVLEDGLSSGIPSSDSEYGDYDYQQESEAGESGVTTSGSTGGQQQQLVPTSTSTPSHSMKHMHSHHHHHHHHRHHAHHQQQQQTALSATCSPLKSPVDLLQHQSSRKSKLQPHFRPAAQDSLPPHYPHRLLDPENQHPNAHHPHDHHGEDCDTDQETDRLLGAQRSDEKTVSGYEEKGCPENHSFSPVNNTINGKKKNGDSGANNGSAGATGLVANNNTSREVLIEGVLFRARYLGSTQLICEGQPTKATRMLQAEEAVSRIKVRSPELCAMDRVCRSSPNPGSSRFLFAGPFVQIVFPVLLFLLSMSFWDYSIPPGVQFVSAFPTATCFLVFIALRPDVSLMPVGEHDCSYANIL